MNQLIFIGILLAAFLQSASAAPMPKHRSSGHSEAYAGYADVRNCGHQYDFRFSELTRNSMVLTTLLLLPMVTTMAEISLPQRLVPLRMIDSEMIISVNAWWIIMMACHCGALRARKEAHNGA